MHEMPSDRDSLVDTRVNFWPPLVDAVTSVLVLMFLLYLIKDAGELEAIKARKAMTALQVTIEQRFREAGLQNVIHCGYTPNILSVTFSDAVLFDTRQYVIQPHGKRVLQICAGALNASDAPHFEQIQVEGHSDRVRLEDNKYPHDNWELSSARALAVLKELLSLGVRPGIISANGYADKRLVDPGRGPEADKKNRRIELRIIYKVPRNQADGGR